MPGRRWASRNLGRLDEGRVGRGEMLVEEVPVCSTGPQEVLLCKELLEEIPRKRKAEVSTNSGDDLDATGSVRSNLLASSQRKKCRHRTCAMRFSPALGFSTEPYRVEPRQLHAGHSLE